ncbi:formylmethanofuran dehydrogenase subunit B [Paludisphaera rhizosphaerae]|uniref:formylmethanofuran dehydrogenase subunit B n=1 Tax=Paludisphaera rhizosphaerae TaxID=2711216 RepID=UPI0013EE1329|nr:formylmethanofuran dehydrogenase subunit B [Paludisphaera rhizosphaerae]
MTLKDEIDLASAEAPFTCTLCGCLCDDILLEVESGRVVEARNACDMARPILIGVPTIPEDSASPRRKGRDVTIEEAVSECARILGESQAPVIVGLERSTNETVRKVVGLADRLGATLEIGEASAAWARITAMQRVGAVGATLGEVKARADVIVFWACDPATTHPRHFERYSIDAVGRFVPGGRESRRVIVFDVDETPTARLADHFVRIERGRELNLLNVLRALVRGCELEPDRVEEATGHRIDDLQTLVKVLRGARYGAWFYGAFAGRAGAEGAEGRHHAVTALVRELARGTRFVALGLGEPGNSHGAEGVLGWQSGFTPGVDFAAGFPESLPGETSAAGRLATGEFDAALVLGEVPEPSHDALESRPWIFIGSPRSQAFDRADVALPAGTAGVDDSGTFTRVDGVVLPVRAFRPRSSPGAQEWLDRIERAVAASKAGASQ